MIDRPPRVLALGLFRSQVAVWLVGSPSRRAPSEPKVRHDSPSLELLRGRTHLTCDPLGVSSSQI